MDFKEERVNLTLRKRSFAAVLLAASLAVAVLPVASQAQAAQATIDAVAVLDGQVTVTGQNFGPAPTVTLGGAGLAVASASDTEIVAQLPALEPGVYVLIVSWGAESVRTSLTIG